MKKLIVCLLVLALPAISFSADDGKRESVETLLGLINAESMIDNIYSQMELMMKGIGQQFGIQPSEQEMFDQFMIRTVKMMKAEMNWAKMKSPMIEIYMKHYTEKELKDMVEFYSTDTGQSVIRKMPEVMKDSMLLSQQMARDFIPKLQAMTKEFEQELAAARKKQ